MRTIDLNADVGEGSPHDAELIPLVTSANIACGGHAGDVATMHDAVRIAIEHNVAIGAHPGHKDREHFGRRELPITPIELRELVCEQLEVLDIQAWAIQGETISYVKLHGALYHQVNADSELADSAIRVIAPFWSEPSLLGAAGSALEAAAVADSIPFFAEAFVDRAYNDDGQLVPRSEPGATLKDLESVTRQAVEIAKHERVTTLSGKVIPIRCDSLCLHGDNEQAIANARAVRSALEREEIELRAFTQ